MLFTGETERSIDEKQRISVPADMRVGFPSGFVYASPGPNGVIWLSPEHVFEKKASAMEQTLFQDEDVMEFEQILFSQSRRIEIDKQGRVRLPDSLLQLAKVKGQAHIIGVGDHLEVMNQTKWEAVKAKLSKLHEYMARASKQARTRGESSP
jgi:MraZ protein